MPVNFSEEQWRSWEDDPLPMLEFAGRTISQRKTRLFYCACVRRLWSWVKDSRSRAAVECSELFGDDCITSDQLLEARKAGYSAWYEIASRSIDSAEDNAAAAAFMCANEELVYASGVPGRVAAASGNEPAEYKTQAAIIRDVLGNPFRPIIPTDSTTTASQVVELAQAIYEERAFDRMPVLVAELEKAGCTDPAILSHCREPEPHVRGCWVVDLILGKK